MIFPDCSGCADKPKCQKEQSGDFQPEHMQHMTDVADCDAAGLVKARTQRFSPVLRPATRSRARPCLSRSGMTKLASRATAVAY